MKNKNKGPFKIIIDCDDVWPFKQTGFSERRHSCRSYQVCLEMASALDWDDFSCKSCCGQYNKALYWRSKQKAYKSKVLKKICNNLDQEDDLQS